MPTSFQARRLELAATVAAKAAELDALLDPIRAVDRFDRTENEREAIKQLDKALTALALVSVCLVRGARQ